MISKIDLNSDLGEGAGFDNQLLSLVSSANIATGFHAGDADTMRETISAAVRQGVALGAHPSLFDRENFGRKEYRIAAEQLYDIVRFQLGVFQAIAQAAGGKVKHVKPHGALYNMAARDQEIADPVAQAMRDLDPGLLLFAPGASALAAAGRQNGLTVVAEVFADRGYMSDGSLIPRHQPGALLTDPELAAARVVRMVREGMVESVSGVDVQITAETVCVHGDTPDAVEFARALRRKLEELGVEIVAPVKVP